MRTLPLLLQHDLLERLPREALCLIVGGFPLLRYSRSTAFARRSLCKKSRLFAAALTRDLDRCVVLEHETMAILAELTALTVGGSWQAMV
jgi:hypothetical protein